MPLFMDVHHNLGGSTLADIEHAHLRDVEAQARHGVQYLRFFHDADGGEVYCVAEAPSAEACVAVHVEANGMRPDRIIPVAPIVVDGFLGGGETTPAGTVVDPETGEPDTGTRTIMFTDIVASTRLTVELGDRGGVALVVEHDRLAREQLILHNGRQVKHTGDGLMASFRSGVDAVACAVDLQRRLAEYRQTPDALPLQVRIGLNTGEPVAAHGDLFGIAVNVSRRLCDDAAPDEILVSDIVAGLVERSSHPVEPLGERSFKGLAEPMAVHRIRWR